jgi:hypothetical protein
MEAMLEISLYSYLYLKPAKMLCLSYCLLLLFNKLGEWDGGTGSSWSEPGVGLGDRWPKQFKHMNECKNYKIKENKNKKYKWKHVLK